MTENDIPWMSDDEEAVSKLHTYEVRVAYVTYLKGEVLASSREQARELASRPVFVSYDKRKGPAMVLDIRRTDDGVGAADVRSYAVSLANEMLDEYGPNMERDAYIEDVTYRGSLDEEEDKDIYWRAYLFATGRAS